MNGRGEPDADELPSDFQSSHGWLGSLANQKLTTAQSKQFADALDKLWSECGSQSSFVSSKCCSLVLSQIRSKRWASDDVIRSLLCSLPTVSCPWKVVDCIWGVLVYGIQTASAVPSPHPLVTAFQQCPEARPSIGACVRKAYSVIAAHSSVDGRLQQLIQPVLQVILYERSPATSHVSVRRTVLLDLLQVLTKLNTLRGPTPATAGASGSADSSDAVCEERLFAEPRDVGLYTHIMTVLHKYLKWLKLVTEEEAHWAVSYLEMVQSVNGVHSAAPCCDSGTCNQTDRLQNSLAAIAASWMLEIWSNHWSIDQILDVIFAFPRVEATVSALYPALLAIIFVAGPQYAKRIVAYCGSSSVMSEVNHGMLSMALVPMAHVFRTNNCEGQLCANKALDELVSEDSAKSTLGVDVETMMCYLLRIQSRLPLLTADVENEPKEQFITSVSHFVRTASDLPITFLRNPSLALAWLKNIGNKLPGADAAATSTPAGLLKLSTVAMVIFGIIACPVYGEQTRLVALKTLQRITSRCAELNVPCLSALSVTFFHKNCDDPLSLKVFEALPTFDGHLLATKSIVQTIFWVAGEETSPLALRIMCSLWKRNDAVFQSLLALLCKCAESMLQTRDMLLACAETVHSIADTRDALHGLDIVPFIPKLLDAPKRLDPHGNAVAMAVTSLSLLVMHEQVTFRTIWTALGETLLALKEPAARMAVCELQGTIPDNPNSHDLDLYLQMKSSLRSVISNEAHDSPVASAAWAALGQFPMFRDLGAPGDEEPSSEAGKRRADAKRTVDLDHEELAGLLRKVCFDADGVTRYCQLQMRDELRALPRNRKKAGEVVESPLDALRRQASSLVFRRYEVELSPTSRPIIYRAMLASYTSDYITPGRSRHDTAERYLNFFDSLMEMPMPTLEQMEGLSMQWCRMMDDFVSDLSAVYEEEGSMSPLQSALTVKEKLFPRLKKHSRSSPVCLFNSTLALSALMITLHTKATDCNDTESQTRRDQVAMLTFSVRTFGMLHFLAFATDDRPEKSSPHSDEYTWSTEGAIRQRQHGDAFHAAFFLSLPAMGQRVTDGEPERQKTLLRHVQTRATQAWTRDPGKTACQVDPEEGLVENAFDLCVGEMLAVFQKEVFGDSVRSFLADRDQSSPSLFVMYWERLGMGGAKSNGYKRYRVPTIGLLLGSVVAFPALADWVGRGADRDLTARKPLDVLCTITDVLFDSQLHDWKNMGLKGESRSHLRVIEAYTYAMGVAVAAMHVRESVVVGKEELENAYKFFAAAAPHLPSSVLFQGGLTSIMLARAQTGTVNKMDTDLFIRATVSNFTEYPAEAYAKVICHFLSYQISAHSGWRTQFARDHPDFEITVLKAAFKHCQSDDADHSALGLAALGRMLMLLSERDKQPRDGVGDGVQHAFPDSGVLRMHYDLLEQMGKKVCAFGSVPDPRPIQKTIATCLHNLVAVAGPSMPPCDWQSLLGPILMYKKEAGEEVCKACIQLLLSLHRSSPHACTALQDCLPDTGYHVPLDDFQYILASLSMAHIGKKHFLSLCMAAVLHFFEDDKVRHNLPQFLAAALVEPKRERDVASLSEQIPAKYLALLFSGGPGQVILDLSTLSAPLVSWLWKSSPVAELILKTRAVDGCRLVAFASVFFRFRVVAAEEFFSHLAYALADYGNVAESEPAMASSCALLCPFLVHYALAERTLDSMTSQVQTFLANLPPLCEKSAYFLLAMLPALLTLAAPGAQQQQPLDVDLLDSTIALSCVERNPLGKLPSLLNGDEQAFLLWWCSSQLDAAAASCAALARVTSMKPLVKVLVDCLRKQHRATSSLPESLASTFASGCIDAMFKASPGMFDENPLDW